ncbi:hypothetical protein AU194_20375 [Mycobacterium sp. GA-2829]|nr:hypothetical protein AU194_20375 [Mycobacterium sp. GA-2829]
MAKAAGVSKDAIYRRYTDAQALLLDALADQSIPTLAADEPPEQALIAFAHDLFRYFAGGDGYANLRVHVDGPQHPAILQQYRNRVVEPQLAKAVEVLEQARRDGRIDADVSPSAVIEALGGAVMICALASPPLGAVEPTDAAVARQLTAFVQQILHGRVTDPRS